MLTQRLAFVGDLVVEDRADLTEVAGNERLRLHRVGLHHVAGVHHDVVHRNHDALLGSFLFRGRQNGVVEIAGTVSTETGRRQHGAHEHHGLLAAQREIQEVRRFFHRIRAVCNHEAVELAAVFVYRFIQLQPHVVRHVLGADLHNLLRRDFRNVRKLRHGCHEVVHRHLTRLVGRTRRRSAGTRDRAACCKHFDLGETGSRRRHAGTRRCHGNEGLDELHSFLLRKEAAQGESAASLQGTVESHAPDGNARTPVNPAAVSGKRDSRPQNSRDPTTRKQSQKQRIAPGVYPK